VNDERVALRGGALELRPDCMHEARRPVAAAMSPLNDPQVVVSSTLTDPTWQNTNVLSGDVVEAVWDASCSSPRAERSASTRCSTRRPGTAARLACV
jgi:hypothetical protein